VRIILFLGNHTEINQRLSMSQKLILKYGIHTYHVGLGALRHVHDLDGDDLAVEREAARPVHDGGAPVSDRLEQLVVRRPDGELPLPPLVGRGRPRLTLPLLREPHRLHLSFLNSSYPSDDETAQKLITAKPDRSNSTDGGNNSGSADRSGGDLASEALGARAGRGGGRDRGSRVLAFS
jgi:hypothetical protein